jgi:hypothetical protein
MEKEPLPEKDTSKIVASIESATGNTDTLWLSKMKEIIKKDGVLEKGFKHIKAAFDRAEEKAHYRFQIAKNLVESGVTIGDCTLVLHNVRYAMTPFDKKCLTISISMCFNEDIKTEDSFFETICSYRFESSALYIEDNDTIEMINAQIYKDFRFRNEGSYGAARPELCEVIAPTNKEEAAIQYEELMEMLKKEKPGEEGVKPIIGNPKFPDIFDSAERNNDEP